MSLIHLAQAVAAAPAFTPEPWMFPVLTAIAVVTGLVDAIAGVAG
jgi:hypothetical protein